jgi:hypothetical protein
MRCAAITAGGERCSLAASGGEYCWSHDPANAAKRRQQARRGGKAKGASGEIHMVKREIKRLLEALEKGEIDRGIGAVMFQGMNLWLKALETERSVKESEELSVMVDELWQEHSRRKQLPRAFSGDPRL